MSYKYSTEELYGRAFFCFNVQDQQINIAFEPLKDDVYLIIIFSEDGCQINGENRDKILDTVYNILTEFDDNRKLKYKIAKLS